MDAPQVVRLPRSSTSCAERWTPMSSTPSASAGQHRHRSAWTVIAGIAVFTAVAGLLVGLGPLPRTAMYGALCVLYGANAVGSLLQARRSTPTDPEPAPSGAGRRSAALS
ncbi:hypothetical protein ACFQZ4_49195 [Catellatospora coxensis]